MAPAQASYTATKTFKLSQTELTLWADGKEEGIRKQIPFNICLRFLGLTFYYFLIFLEIVEEG